MTIPAVVLNPLNAQETQPEGQDAHAHSLLSGRSMNDTVAALEERAAGLRQFAEDVSGGRVSPGHIAEKLETCAEDVRNNAESSAGAVYSDVSELLARLRKEIEEIRSFDGFLVGVHDKIEKFNEPVEFRGEQVQDVQQHMTEVNAKLELGIFSLARVREQALRALRGQQQPEPQRVLDLLKDDVTRPVTAEQAVTQTAAPSGRDVLIQVSVKAWRLAYEPDSIGHGRSGNRALRKTGATRSV